MRDKEDTAEFWQELEEEIGEKVIWYSLGELLLPFGGMPKHTVGMFFLTSKLFYFQTFPRNDILRVLANSFRKKKREDGRIQKGYPLGGLLSAELERPRGVFRRIAAGTMPVAVLRFDEEAAGSEKTVMRFTLLDKQAGEELMRNIGTGKSRGADT